PTLPLSVTRAKPPLSGSACWNLGSTSQVLSARCRPHRLSFWVQRTEGSSLSNSRVGLVASINRPAPSMILPSSCQLKNDSEFTPSGLPELVLPSDGCDDPGENTAATLPGTTPTTLKSSLPSNR